MPLLDSFKVDHTKMTAPSLRVAKTMETPKGDKITVFDLRFTKPNVEKPMSPKGIHTLEHLFAGFMREYINHEDFSNEEQVEVIDLSPMGCRTGFYMSVIGEPSLHRVSFAWMQSMLEVTWVKSEDDIPELNEYQCGTYKMHSLKKAKKIANHVIEEGITDLNNEDLLLKEFK